MIIDTFFGLCASLALLFGLLADQPCCEGLASLFATTMERKGTTFTKFLCGDTLGLADITCEAFFTLKDIITGFAFIEWVAAELVETSETLFAVCRHAACFSFVGWCATQRGDWILWITEQTRGTRSFATRLALWTPYFTREACRFGKTDPFIVGAVNTSKLAFALFATTRFVLDDPLTGVL
tara:strand:- start:2277 stop:2822 length:546 start_codon:yes stop_codon:yes gene_type:complete